MKSKERTLAMLILLACPLRGNISPRNISLYVFTLFQRRDIGRLRASFASSTLTKIRKNPVLSKTIVVEWPRCRGWGNCPCASAVHPCDRGAESLPRPCREVEVTNRNLRTEITKGKTNIAFEGLNRASTLKGKIKI